MWFREELADTGGMVYASASCGGVGGCVLQYRIRKTKLIYRKVGLTQLRCCGIVGR